MPSESQSITKGHKRSAQKALFSVSLSPGTQLSLSLSAVAGQRDEDQQLLIAIAASSVEAEATQPETADTIANQPPALPEPLQDEPESSAQGPSNPSFVVAGSSTYVPRPCGRPHTLYSSVGPVIDPRSEEVRLAEYHQQNFRVEPKSPPDFCRPFPARRVG